MHDRMPLLSDKRELRLWMRRVRRELDNRPTRSELLWQIVETLPEVRNAENILVFTTVPGEPELATFASWCAAEQKSLAVPEDNVKPGWPDVVIVPGLAFTANGDRLGQGGGWYDRFLSSVDANCATVGVGFAEQLVESVPLEPHDVRLDYVVTDKGIACRK